uniref:Uncharacterized protein n=1 Tax=Romanomermis culicivorax TaxID=13658 RepID=A0A915HFW7_ROMCU
MLESGQKSTYAILVDRSDYEKQSQCIMNPSKFLALLVVLPIVDIALAIVVLELTTNKWLARKCKLQKK